MAGMSDELLRKMTQEERVKALGMETAVSYTHLTLPTTPYV